MGLLTNFPQSKRITMDKIIRDSKLAIAALFLVSCVSFADSHSMPPSLEAADFAAPLSDTVLSQHQTQLQQWIQSELDMLGLGKITSVAAPIPSALIEFRQSWAKTDAEVAPFLGSWFRDWNLHPHDFMTVFPSKKLGQVCIIRTRRDMTQTVPFQEFTTPPEFSVAKVVEGQLLGTHTQSARSLLFPTPASEYLPYATQFLGTVEPNGNQRLYAAQNLPSIDPTWDSNIRQQLDTYGCISN